MNKEILNLSFPILSDKVEDSVSSPSVSAQQHRQYTARLRQYNYNLHQLWMLGLVNPYPLTWFVIRGQA